ncbi:hypothetical protein SAMN02745165_00533 [Malonomonas rubra DSM 5091]|uniref:Phosphate-selective porin O and P n=1 Tax=Malonomonas rubra DSM 5091 TaxID=1122189 RepID=A0A1M6CHS3_MALRU|nr:hypothetical protein [Malonomonas rubra]SHI60572.1 hypothetical protein SAMN02745165_00533 [Malonomonas rubra DSM 5091]
MKKIQLFVLTLLFLLLATPLLAFDLAESLQIHGFVSQGYMSSSNNNFLTESRSGSYEFTDLGLNLNWMALDNLRLGGQAFYRNLGNYSEDNITLDWALVDYQPSDWLGVRLGKVKMPLGLYNETRDSDFLQPMIFLPQSIYDESRRDTNLAYIGGGLYGNLPVGSWGDIDYHVFTGESTYPDDSILTQSTNNSISESIRKNKTNPLLPDSFESSERKSDGLYGGAIVFNSAAHDLRLGFSLFRSKNNVYVNGSSTPLMENTVKRKFVFSLEYLWRDWMFVSEYGETDRKTSQAGKVTMDGPSQSWYVMLSYAPFERWTFTVLYDEFYRLKYDRDGSTKPQSPSYTAWRKDLGGAIRYEINDDWVLKAEYHYIDGSAMQLNVVNPDKAYPDRYWSYFAAKLSYSF